MRRTVNLKLLVVLVAVLAGMAGGTHFLHAYQMKRNARVLLKHAERLEEQGKLAEAASYLGRYLVYEPQDVDALARYGVLLEKFPESPGTRGRAAFVLEQVLRHDPKRSEVRRKLIQVEMQLGRYGDARDHLNLLLKEDCRDDGELEELLGRCHEAAGEFGRAAQDYQKAVKHAPARVESHVNLSRVLRLRLGRPAEADAVMDALVRHSPRLTAAYLARARYRLEYGQKGAAEDIQKARELAPEDADVYLVSAQLLRQDGQPEQAVHLLERALKKHPKDIRLYQVLARLLMETHQADKAVSCLRSGLEALPGQPGLLWALAERLIESRLDVEASDLIARMGRAGFRPARLDYLRGRLHMTKGQWSEATNLLLRRRPHLTSSPDLLKQVELNLAQCHAALGDSEQQMAAYRRAIALDSRWLPPRLGLGAALAKLGRLEEAISEYQQATALPGAPASAWLSLARLQLENTVRQPAPQQDWQTVERPLQRAKEQLPDSPQVPVVEAQLLLARGQPDQAQTILERARDRRPEQIELWAALIGMAQARPQPEQAEALVHQAQQRLGDTPAVRTLAAGYWSTRPAAEARPALGALLTELEKFPAAQQEQLRVSLARAYHRAGLLPEARQQWDEIARRKPDDLHVRLEIFDLTLEAGEEAGLAPAVEQIKRLEGSDGVLWRLAEAARRMLAARRGDRKALADARTLSLEAATRRPGWPRVALLEADIAELEKNTEKALEKYRRALALGERRMPVVRRTVQLLYDRHRYAEADQVIRRLQGPGGLKGDLGRMAAELSLFAHNPVRALELAQQAVSSNSANYRDHIWLAQVQAAAGQAKEAEQSFRRALELGRKEPAAWMALVSYLARRQQSQQAEELLRDAQTTLPAAQVSLTLAIGFEMLGKQQEAETNYKAALAKRPGDVAALAQIARFYVAVGRRPDAEPHFRFLLGGKVKITDAEKHFARRGLALCLADQDDFTRFNQALGLLQENAKHAVDSNEDQRVLGAVLATRPSRRREAIGILESLNNRQRLLPGDRFLLARLYEAAKNWAKARSRMLELLAAEPDNPIYLSFYLDALLRHRDANEAEVWLDKLVRIEPNSFRTINLRARLLTARGQTADAVRVITHYAGEKGADLARAAVLLEDLGQAAAAEPLYRRYAATSRKPEAILTLALYLARSQKVGEALRLCEKAWDTCSPERVAAVSVDVLQIGRADDSEARKVEEKINAVSREQGESPIFDLALGQLYYQRQRYAEAEQSYRSALRQDSENRIGLNNLAWLLTLRSRKPEEALELVNRAIARTGTAEDLYERAANSSVPNLLDTRAITYLALGQAETALKDLEPAVAHVPTRNGCYHLALAYRMAGNGEAAERALKQAANLGFRSEQVDPLERKAVEQMMNQK